MGATWSNWVNLERERVVAVPINVYIYIYTITSYTYKLFTNIIYTACLFVLEAGHLLISVGSFLSSVCDLIGLQAQKAVFSLQQLKHPKMICHMFSSQ